MPHRVTLSAALTYLTLVVLLAGSFWLLKITPKTPPPTDAKQRQKAADYFLKQFETVETHLDSKQQYRLSGSHLTHFPQHQYSDITDIRVQMTGKAQNRRIIQADNGQMSDDGQQLTLENNVRLVNHSPSAQKTVTITSQSLTIYPQKEYAHTEDRVQIQAENFSIQATGMTNWWNTQKLQLHNHVHTTYTRPTP